MEDYNVVSSETSGCESDCQLLPRLYADGRGTNESVGEIRVINPANLM